MPSENYRLISYSEVKDTLNNITNDIERQLLKTVYAGCARVGEITRSKYCDNEPLSSEHLEVSPSVLVINLFTEKTHLPRRVPLSRIDDPTQTYFKKSEAWLTEDILARAFVSAGTMFPFSTWKGEKIFKKHFPEFNYHIHYLRHWRATHLLQGTPTGTPVPERVVQKIGGWTSTAILSRVYDSSVIEDYIRI